MSTFGQMLAGGVAAILLLKLLMAVVLPMVGMVLGFLGLMAKLALIMAVGMVVLAIFRRQRRVAQHA